MGKLQVVAGSGSVAEGRYYREQDEDGEHVVFDYYVVVEVAGKHYSHFKGHRFHSDAEALLHRVEAAGEVDLKYWAEVPEQPSLEERLAPFGLEWQLEQDERRFNGY